MNSNARFRPEQADIVTEYEGGKVGIAAVPGSGKTFTLAHLAARLIGTGRVTGDEEVLIVTLTNSAVNSFRARIARILQEEYGLLANVGYRVRTLHGLAHDIVRERPALVGLAEDFSILDEAVALDIQREIVAQRLSEWRGRLEQFLDPQSSGRSAWRTFERDLSEIIMRFIQRAKDRRLSAMDLRAGLEQFRDETFDLARFAVEVFADYERSLAYRGAVDFDDLVGLAIEALHRDTAFLGRLQARWPFVLEDEAQDSSRLQEEMLSLLSGERNWVRVGDPNQAIFTTFTTADLEFLRRFLGREDVVERPLSVSGRSAAPIVDLANELVRWCVEEHPNPALRAAFEYQPRSGLGSLRGVIRLTPPDDPQPNPPDDTAQLVLAYDPGDRFTPEQELRFVISDSDLSLKMLIEDIRQLADEEPKPTVAVLVPENSRGYKLAEALRREGITEYDELLRSTATTRAAVRRLVQVLDFLSRPDDLKRLKRVFWEEVSGEQREAVNRDADVRAALSSYFSQRGGVEGLLWPELADEADGTVEEVDLGEYAWLQEALRQFRVSVGRWLRLKGLPVDQLVLAIAQDLFDDPADIALAHKIAVMLRAGSRSHPDWRLPQFVDELRLISQNQRRFMGFDTVDVGFEPRPGVVTIATMHAAKGLEWDRVYLLAVNNYDFPSVMPHDAYIGEKWYVRAGGDGLVEHLNLEAELLAQLACLVGDAASYAEGEATMAAREARAAERLRLLYVGITRARRELVISWNMGRFWNKGKAYENQPALPLVWLGQYVEQTLSRGVT